MCLSKVPGSTRHFCILPWVHVMVHQNGAVQICCRDGELAHAYGLLTQERDFFEKIWNGHEAKTMRKALLKDQALPQCEACYREEARGKQSLRLASLEQFQGCLNLREQTSPDGYLAEPPQYLGLRLSNLCNLRCRTCSPGSSSAWVQDGLALSGKPAENSAIPFRFEPEFTNLKQLYFAGGEPLLQKEHYQLLEKMIALNKTDVRLVYNSNITVLGLQAWDVVEFWRKFPNVEVNASFDGVLSQSNLLRKGSHWNELETNFLYLRKKLPHVKLVVNPTASVMNAFHLITAIAYWVEHGLIDRPGSLKINVLDFPLHFNIAILNSNERKNLTTALREFFDELSSTLDPSLSASIIAELSPLIHLCDAAPELPQSRHVFKNVTFKLDRLRQERFIDLFPEHIGLLYE